MNFCVAILISKVEENIQHFWHVMLYYFKKGKNTTETRCVQCKEKVLWLTDCIQSGLQSFVLKVSRWTMLHNRVDQWSW